MGDAQKSLPQDVEAWYLILYICYLIYISTINTVIGSGQWSLSPLLLLWF